MSGGIIPELKRIMVMITDGRGIFPVPTVEYQGKLWLAPQWIVSDPPGYKMPAYIISLENLAIQDLRQMPNSQADYAVGEPIPRSVLEGRASPEEAIKYPTAVRPPLRFQIPPPQTIR